MQFKVIVATVAAFAVGSAIAGPVAARIANDDDGAGPGAGPMLVVRAEAAPTANDDNGPGRGPNGKLANRAEAAPAANDNDGNGPMGGLAIRAEAAPTGGAAPTHRFDTRAEAAIHLARAEAAPSIRQM
ncbi:hypothetical protein AC579_6965 [Pseudocercospora musae]|uniref:Uncharacterized protein n=1 Tax=Pseudocercospora musae TaxID=113226 RepID=A0A139IAN5_9PEZI|nr:hypothetical protein AC579_6965 [Pseudocercospora musae]